MVLGICIRNSDMRYLLAIFFACSMVFAFLAYYYHERADSYCELLKRNKANVDFLIRERRKDIEKTIQISERNRELEEEAKMDKSYFDWNYDISHTNVILRLRKN